MISLNLMKIGAVNPRITRVEIFATTRPKIVIAPNTCISTFIGPIFTKFLARDVIYASRAYATMSVSVCLTEVHWVARCMPGTQRLRQPAKLKPSYDPHSPTNMAAADGGVISRYASHC